MTDNRKNEDRYVYVLMEVDTCIEEQWKESGRFEDYQEELGFVGVFATQEQAEVFMKGFVKEHYPDRDFFFGISNKWRYEGDAVRNNRVKFIIHRIPFMPDVSIAKDIQMTGEFMLRP